MTEETEVDKSSMQMGTCGHFCEACARRDDEIKRLRELTKSVGLSLIHI